VNFFILSLIFSPTLFSWGNEHEPDAESAYIARRKIQFEAAQKALLSLGPETVAHVTTTRSKANTDAGETAANTEADRAGNTEINGGSRLYPTSLRIEHPGLCIHESLPWLAASPDGFVTEILETTGDLSIWINGGSGLVDAHGDLQGIDLSQGIVEYKCPYSQRDRPPSSIAPFYRRMRQPNGILAPIPPYYFDQIQGTMAVTGRLWCDFVVWTPSQTQVSRYFFDSEYWSKSLLPSLEDFYFNLLLPALVAKQNVGVEEAVQQFCR